MKLYLAGNSGHMVPVEKQIAKWGGRRLVSYSDIVHRHDAYGLFWIETRSALLKLYFAGGSANRFVMPLEVAAGIRHRLVTYADVAGVISNKHRAVPDFWISERTDALKLYIAGNGKSNGSAQRDYDTGARNRLLSYAFEKDWAKDEFEFWINNDPAEADVFLDSGAFSAHTLGREIDLAEYCAYLHAHKAALSAYFSLDVIGSVDGSQRNLETMWANDLDPVPVYHVGSEPLSVLKDLLSNTRVTYIALGGMASDRPTKEYLRGKLDACWNVIAPHWPVKVHGLGILAQWALERYPFYSVDGSSAIVAAGMGRVTRLGQYMSVGKARNIGLVLSDGWREDVACTYDGIVADGVGRVAEGAGSASAHEGRRVRNIQAQLAFERNITEGWERRGVVWNS